MRSDDEKREHEQMIELAMRARRSYLNDPEFHAMVTVIVQEKYAQLRVERDAAVARADDVQGRLDRYHEAVMDRAQVAERERDEALVRVDHLQERHYAEYANHASTKAALAESVAREQHLRDALVEVADMWDRESRVHTYSSRQHGPLYADGFEAGWRHAAGLLRDALAAVPSPAVTPEPAKEASE